MTAVATALAAAPAAPVAPKKQGVAADLAQLVDHRPVNEALLASLLRLFDGHDVPAVYWARGRKQGFYKQPNLRRRTAFKAHLLGVVMVGVYPFRGVFVRCGCGRDKHTCDGGGTNYICLDLDAHDGETDTFKRVASILKVCSSLRLFPLVATSRSGKGAHVFLFLNRRVTTVAANAAGKAITAEAGIRDRCDVIPSAGHYKGFGTLHALPLTPMAEPGGGLVLDADLRPLQGDALVNALHWANTWRSDAGVVEALAPAGLGVAASSTRAGKVVPLLSLKAEAAPGTVLASILKHHPQFRRVLTMDPAKWRGKRSSRDAYLAGYLRRQKLSTEEIARVLASIPDTKTAERGLDYAVALVEAQAAIKVAVTVPLAGVPAPPQSELHGNEPWVNRVAPPRDYVGSINPWWTDGVQEKLRLARTTDRVLLAYLIDRYYRGPIHRRMFFASAREIGEALGFPARTVSNTINRLADRFSDVIRVVPGVPHPHLRIATAYYVVDQDHKDRLDWCIRPGRSQEDALSYGHASMVDGDLGPGPEHASSSYDRSAKEPPDADAEGLFGERAGAVLSGEPRVDARAEGPVVPGPGGSGQRAGAGREERRISTPSRSESARGVRSPTVSPGPAAVHSGGTRRRRVQRTRRDARSAYTVGEDTVLNRGRVPARGIDADPR